VGTTNPHGRGLPSTDSRLKSSHLLAFLTLVLFTCAAPGCPHRKWNGPSTHYQALDRIEVKDGKVARSEWEGMYGVCLKGFKPNCAWAFAEYLAEFSCADQDRSGYLTWSEYYDFRFANTVQCPLLHSLRTRRPDFDQQGNFRMPAPEGA
jgi:hypothetical protein